MKVVDLLNRLDIDERWDAPVVVMDETGKLYSVKEVVYEPIEHDDEGNAISTGPTLFLKVEES